MARLIVSFDEIGVDEFNGMPIRWAAPAIINKAVDGLIRGIWHGCDDENFIDYSRTVVCFVTRQVCFAIRLR